MGEYEEKILKLKIYQIYQKENLNELLNDEKFKNIFGFY